MMRQMDTTAAKKSPERHKEDEGESTPPTQPVKPHRVILVQESPTHLAASKQELSNSSSPSNTVKDKDSGILEPNGHANICEFLFRSTAVSFSQVNEKSYLSCYLL